MGPSCPIGISRFDLAQTYKVRNSWTISGMKSQIVAEEVKLSFPALEINQLYLILDKAKFLCLVIKPLLTKLVQSWWLDVSLVLVSFFFLPFS